MSIVAIMVTILVRSISKLVVYKSTLSPQQKKHNPGKNNSKSEGMAVKHQEGSHGTCPWAQRPVPVDQLAHHRESPEYLWMDVPKKNVEINRCVCVFVSSVYIYIYNTYIIYIYYIIYIILYILYYIISWCCLIHWKQNGSGSMVQGQWCSSNYGVLASNGCTLVIPATPLRDFDRLTMFHPTTSLPKIHEAW